jgi:hypothetical protein
MPDALVELAVGSEALFFDEPSTGELLADLDGPGSGQPLLRHDIAARVERDARRGKCDLERPVVSERLGGEVPTRVTFRGVCAMEPIMKASARAEHFGELGRCQSS